MIDETELTDLLSTAAADYDVPNDGPDRILDAAATGRAPDVQPWWRAHRLAIAAVVVVVVLGSTVVIRQVGHGGGNTTGLTALSTPGTAESGESLRAQTTGRQAGLGAGAGTGSAGSASSGDVAGGAAGGAASSAVAPTVPLAPVSSAATPGAPTATRSLGRPVGDSAKVVKTGSIQVEVRRGAVGSTMVRLTSLATGVNGYVADTRTAEGGDDPTGTMTLRVPADTFDDVVAKVRALGTVRSLTSHGQDVTGQYSDIQARLTALNATRSQLLTILQKATAIGDVLAVQDRINQTQTEIEQLQGQQRMLDDQTSFAALSVEVSQQGAKHGPPDHPTGVAKAWDDARHGFTSGVEAILAASGTTLVVLLMLAAAFAVLRAGWLVLRRRLV